MVGGGVAGDLFGRRASSAAPGWAGPNVPARRDAADQPTSVRTEAMMSVSPCLASANSMPVRGSW